MKIKNVKSFENSENSTQRKIPYLSLFTQKLRHLLCNSNAKNFIAGMGIFGILLIFISNSFKCSHRNPTKPNISGNSANFDTDQKTRAEKYTKNLENNLQEIVANIKGAGKTKIFITIESDTENIYATEERSNTEQTTDNFDGESTRKKTSSDTEKKYITTRDSNGNECALKITEIQPKIRGVVVLCRGGEILEVKKKIIEAITTALNISSKKVYVTNCE